MVEIWADGRPGEDKNGRKNLWIDHAVEYKSGRQKSDRTPKTTL